MKCFKKRSAYSSGSFGRVVRGLLSTSILIVAWLCFKKVWFSGVFHDTIPEGCKGCSFYPDMRHIRNLSDCMHCYRKIEVTDLSPKARVRNRQMMQFYTKSKKAVYYERRMPDVIGIGVRKCGTGWLNFILRRHLMLKGTPERMEVHFFNLRKNFDRGTEYYRSMLANVSKHELSIEKTPEYFNYPRWRVNMPEIIHRTVPDAKIWVILCDPVHRALSDFVQVNTTKEAVIPPTFEEYVNEYLPQAERLFKVSRNFSTEVSPWIISDPSSIIISLGIYPSVVNQWFSYFSRDRMIVISGEELISNPGKVIEELQDFLGIPRFILAEDFVKNPGTGFYCLSPTVVINFQLYRIPLACMSRHVKGRTRSPDGSSRISSEILTKLRNFYKPFDDQLFSILGKRLW